MAPCFILFKLTILCLVGIGTTQVILQGAGSTLAYDLYTNAALAYSFTQPGVTLSYSGFGSGRGICRIKNATKECASTDTGVPLAVDFAGSDIILTDVDYASYPDLQMYPTAASAVVPIFNLGSAVPRLLLSTTLLAEIFRGNVSRWDDPGIMALNPNLTQFVPPQQPIILVVRSDVSGTTEIFKKALSAFDSAFAAQVGHSNNSSWPGVTTVAKAGNQGVVSFVLNSMYTLGYSELGTALSNELPVVQLQKSDGAIVTASVTSIQYAVLQLGLNFGNNGDAPAHLTADLENAAGPNAWPIVGYTYLLMRKHTLRPGATCANVNQTVAFWHWFWTSDNVGTIAEQVHLAPLPLLVCDVVVARFVQDITCNGLTVWQVKELPNLHGTGTSLLSGFFDTVANVYTLVQPEVNVSYSATTTTSDVDLTTAMFAATTDTAAAPPPDGVKLIFAGVGVVAVTPLNVTLDGDVLAQILEGTVTTWLDPAIMRINPDGVYDAAGQPVTNISLPIQLLQGPFASSSSLGQLMQKYCSGFTGRAILAASYSSNENLLRSNVLGNPFSLGVTPLTGNFPTGLRCVPFRRPDGSSVSPSWQAIRACATSETFNAAQTTFSLQDSTDPACYPLAQAVHIRVRKSRCSLTEDADRTQTVSFVQWLFSDDTLSNALEANTLAPLMDANPYAQAANDAALDAITCTPKPPAGIDIGLVLGVAAGLGGPLLGLAVAAAYWRRRGPRDNSAAPKDEGQSFCVLFTDIESSTYLWAMCPAEMAQALDVHHRIIRQLIAQHRLYEVKTIGDSFMCATPDPARALAFALQLQLSFFSEDWGMDGALDAAYEAKRRAEEDSMKLEPSLVPKGSTSSSWPAAVDGGAVWNGLRVRVGAHYGRGNIKLDPVTGGYDYYGTVVNTAARIESACHGGQIGVSQAVHDAVSGRGPLSVWTSLGPQPLRGLAEPVVLYQVLPAGVLAQRTFPPLRLEKDWDPRGGDDVVYEADSSERKDSAITVSVSTGTGAATFQAEGHPLVRMGQVSAEELQEHYTTALLTLRTLLATQTPKFMEATLKGLCDRLKVRFAGTAGPRLTQTLHGLVLRVLPATFPGDGAAERRPSDGSRFSGRLSASSGSRHLSLRRPASLHTQAQNTAGVAIELTDLDPNRHSF